MQTRRHHDAEPGAGVDVDMRIDAALADEPELGQSLQQRRADFGALANQHQRLGVGEPRRQGVVVLHMVGPDGDVMARHRAETCQRANCIMVIIQDGDFHRELLG